MSQNRVIIEGTGQPLKWMKICRLTQNGKGNVLTTRNCAVHQQKALYDRAHNAWGRWVSNTVSRSLSGYFLPAQKAAL